MATKQKQKSSSERKSSEESNVSNIAIARAKRGKKPASQKRQEAEAAYLRAKDEGNDAATSVARQAVKVIRFKEVVVPRVQKALKVLGQIEKMGNRAVYSWTPEEAEKICRALQTAVITIEQRFSSSAAKEEKESFSL